KSVNKVNAVNNWPRVVNVVSKVPEGGQRNDNNEVVYDRGKMVEP
ncbi:19386_t:CDS:1, partial [Gigaspora rosea]